MDYSISISPHAARTVTETRSIPFGVQPTEHMFTATYKDGQWENPRIIPFENLVMSPLALCLHYGQTVFEGMKAFRMEDGRINIFRPDKHYDRFCKSLQRMCMPEVPKGLFMEALHQLVHLDENWVPAEADGSLYLRPFMIATEERIGVKVSDEYLFMIVCSPAYQYYTKPLSVKVETTFVRSADGGTGAAKCGGNYGGAFYPTQQAREAGYDQVIWTDARHHEFIEESGTMNLMFYYNDMLVTPPLSGTILDGVTRDSLLALAKEMGLQVSVRPVSYREIQDVLEAGKRLEAFGAGTAAVVAPIQTLSVGNKHYNCYTEPDAVMYKLQDALYKIRRGMVPDTHNWNYII
ncbi:branched-chain amino acid aminotransferase [Chitinophagaceae bacterium MMS25-I14]